MKMGTSSSSGMERLRTGQLGLKIKLVEESTKGDITSMIRSRCSPGMVPSSLELKKLTRTVKFQPRSVIRRTKTALDLVMVICLDLMECRLKPSMAAAPLPRSKMMKTTSLKRSSITSKGKTISILDKWMLQGLTDQWDLKISRTRMLEWLLASRSRETVSRLCFIIQTMKISSGRSLSPSRRSQPLRPRSSRAMLAESH